jgi:hypothetical protein
MRSLLVALQFAACAPFSVRKTLFISQPGDAGLMEKAPSGRGFNGRSERYGRNGRRKPFHRLKQDRGRQALHTTPLRRQAEMPAFSGRIWRSPERRLQRRARVFSMNSSIPASEPLWVDRYKVSRWSRLGLACSVPRSTDARAKACMAGSIRFSRQEDKPM